MSSLKALFDGMFRAIDADGSGDISMEEFRAHIKDDKVQALLAMLELEPEDAWALFRLLDRDDSDHIDEAEFIQGCLAMRGSARSIDLAKHAFDQKVARKQNVQFMR